MIDSYSFGRITINGKSYTSDIILLPDRVIPSWWRKEGHSLCLLDLEEISFEHYDAFIVGTGFFGAMKINDEVNKFMEKIGIKLFGEKTKDAVRRYTEISPQIKAVGAFHLTC
jgi:hypothetical protein